MTTWHWVRHGPTHQKTFVGWRDLPADLGDTRQLARLAASLPQTGVLVSSDLRRSVETADALASPQRVRLQHQPGLREIHFGHWDGLHYSTIAKRDPALSRAFWENPGRTCAPGGESWDMAAERVQAAVNTLNARHPDAHVIAVAHFGAILTQVQRALGVTAYAALAHRIDNLSVTRVTWRGARAEVSAINHLP